MKLVLPSVIVASSDSVRVRAGVWTTVMWHWIILLKWYNGSHRSEYLGIQIYEI